MARYLAIVLPLLVLIMALFGLAVLSPAAGAAGVGPAGRLPLPVAAGGWLVESLALTALFLLIQGRSGRWWLDGVVTGFLAWVFRGPILVLSVASFSNLGSGPWRTLSIRWLILYLVCGAALALTARGLGVER